MNTHEVLTQQEVRRGRDIYRLGDYVCFWWDNSVRRGTIRALTWVNGDHLVTLDVDTHGSVYTRLVHVIEHVP